MKKVIKIAHLYPDLMNLYGESGNVRALKRFVERQGVEAQITNLTIGDKMDFKKYDFYFMGCGNDEAEDLVIQDLMPYRDQIDDAVKAGKMFLITGNAMEVFGRKIRYRDGEVKDCLDIFEYQANENSHRISTEILFRYDKLPFGKGGNIFGFRNVRCNIVNNDDYRLFEFANTFNYKNFYAMNFFGPFLVRNPYFTNMLVKKLFEDKGYPYKIIEDTIEFKAYQKYYDNFIVNNPNFD